MLLSFITKNWWRAEMSDEKKTYSDSEFFEPEAMPTKVESTEEVHELSSQVESEQDLPYTNDEEKLDSEENEVEYIETITSNAEIITQEEEVSHLDELEAIQKDYATVVSDLEKAERYSSVQGRKRPHSFTKVKTAKDFFATELLDRFDDLLQEEREILKGKYRFELNGYRGGIWTILVDDDVQVINRKEEADIVFTMQQRDFIFLVNGDINPQLAVLAQKLRITGDIKKAAAVQSLLSPEM